MKRPPWIVGDLSRNEVPWSITMRRKFFNDLAPDYSDLQEWDNKINPYQDHEKTPMDAKTWNEMTLAETKALEEYTAACDKVSEINEKINRLVKQGKEKRASIIRNSELIRMIDLKYFLYKKYLACRTSI